eukprot:69576_1
MLDLFIISCIIIFNISKINCEEYRLAKINNEPTNAILSSIGNQYADAIENKKQSGNFIETTEFDVFKKPMFIELDLSRVYSTLSAEMASKLAQYQYVLEKGLDQSQKVFTATGDSHFEIVFVGAKNNDITIHIYSLSNREKVMLSGLYFCGSILLWLCIYIFV